MNGDCGGCRYELFRIDRGGRLRYFCTDLSVLGRLAAFFGLKKPVIMARCWIARVCCDCLYNGKGWR